MPRNRRTFWDITKPRNSNFCFQIFFEQRNQELGLLTKLIKLIVDNSKRTVRKLTNAETHLGDLGQSRSRSVTRIHPRAQAAQVQCVSLIINTCGFILHNLKWP